MRVRIMRVCVYNKQTTTPAPVAEFPMDMQIGRKRARNSTKRGTAKARTLTISFLAFVSFFIFENVTSGRAHSISHLIESVFFLIDTRAHTRARAHNIIISRTRTIAVD